MRFQFRDRGDDPVASRSTRPNALIHDDLRLQKTAVSWIWSQFAHAGPGDCPELEEAQMRVGFTISRIPGVLSRLHFVLFA